MFPCIILSHLFLIFLFSSQSSFAFLLPLRPVKLENFSYTACVRKLGKLQLTRGVNRRDLASAEQYLKNELESNEKICFDLAQEASVFLSMLFTYGGCLLAHFESRPEGGTDTEPLNPPWLTRTVMGVSLAAGITLNETLKYLCLTFFMPRYDLEITSQGRIFINLHEEGDWED